MPVSVGHLAKINVVTTALLPAAHAKRLLRFKARILGIVIERHRFGHPHGINEMPPAPDATVVTAATNHPVADLGPASNFRLARRECAIAIEGVRCEPAIV